MKLKVEPENFEYYDNKKLKDTGFFNTTTEIFAVNQKVSACYILTNMVIRNYKSIKIIANYEDRKRNPYSRSYEINFDQYLGSTEVLREDVHDISKSIKKMIGTFERLVSLKVTNSNENDL